MALIIEYVWIWSFIWRKRDMNTLWWFQALITILNHTLINIFIVCCRTPIYSRWTWPRWDGPEHIPMLVYVENFFSWCIEGWLLEDVMVILNRVVGSSFTRHYNQKSWVSIWKFVSRGLIFWCPLLSHWMGSGSLGP